MPLSTERVLDAAAVLLVREAKEGKRELFWVRRSREVSLGGGFHALPGGRVDASDAALAERLGHGGDGALRVAAIRELFEEAGVLLASGTFSPERLGEARRELLADRTTLERVVSELGGRLELDALSPAGRWLTPPFVPLRFDAHFFLARLPADQTAEVWPGELADGAWISPAEAIERWRQGTALLHPPALHLFRCLDAAPPPECLPAMVDPPDVEEYVARRIEFQAGVLLVPLRTPTLPPATHTNCYILGEEDLVVLDPGSEYPEEQQALARLCAQLRAEGRRFREILLTHEHHDHVGGVARLREELKVPVRAHPAVRDLLSGMVPVDGTLAADERLDLGGTLALQLRAIHTPGHTQGHFCFLEERTRALFAGDLVAGIGTVVVDPPEGNMSDYVGSLETLRNLGVHTIYPGHGPAVPDGPRKLDDYLAHRREREEQVVAALRTAGEASAIDLVPGVYADVPPQTHPLAARSLSAILEKLVRDGRARLVGTERYRLVERS